MRCHPSQCGFYVPWGDSVPGRGRCECGRPVKCGRTDPDADGEEDATDDDVSWFTVAEGGTCVYETLTQTPLDGCCNCASWTHQHDYAGLCGDTDAVPFRWMKHWPIAPSAGWCLSWKQASPEVRAESAMREGRLF
jgi:hypothetical protein